MINELLHLLQDSGCCHLFWQPADLALPLWTSCQGPSVLTKPLTMLTTPLSMLTKPLYALRALLFLSEPLARAPSSLYACMYFTLHSYPPAQSKTTPLTFCLSLFWRDPFSLLLVPRADVCWRMLTYADVYWRMLTYADVCWRILTYADVCWRSCLSLFSRDPFPSLSSSNRTMFFF